uniref:SHSP domain-containing protein n=1 Tax=Plectus sambesii TaxID=2011161 RepID=A0A914UTP5_9BILA
YEFHRYYVLPQGVKADDVTCKYSTEGVLVVQAPFTPPPEPEPPKETDIEIKRE